MSEITQDLPALRMWRPNVPIPAAELPSGYHIRPLNDNEGESWCLCLLNDMGVNEISQQLFMNKMLDDPSVPQGSILCVEDMNGMPVATATAQLKDGKTAQLHMVGAREDARGKGLGFAVCAAVLTKHYEDGFYECFLTTHDWRLPALKHYIKLGFIPILNHESVRSRWGKILKILDISSVGCVNEDLSFAENITADE